MNVDELQANKLIACGAVPEARLREVWALPPSQPGLDLCGRLLEIGWITPQLAHQIRQEVAYEHHVQTRKDSDSNVQDSSLASSVRSASGSFRSSTGSFRTPPTTLGPYQIEREIARGGMGIVYLGHHPNHPGPLAIKLLTGQKERDFERFEIEVTASKRLSHENIVKIHDAGLDNGKSYMVMDYIDGQPLDEYLLEVDAIDIDQAVDWTISIAEALSHAHENDILHRDLKPSNILLENSDPPKPLLTDFGVAKIEDDDSKNLTNSGEMVGTPQYMPPEQAEGKRELIGPPVDVYSLGATLYEMLTGRPPFNAPTILDLMVKISMAKPEAPSDIVHTIPKDLEAIIMKCLEKQITHRYASCRDLAEDLVRFQRGEEVHASYRSFGANISRWLMMLVGVVLVATAVIGAVIYFSPEEKPLIEPARIRLVSNPAGLTFQIHGEKRDYSLTAPGTLEVPPGTYTIDINDKRFQKDKPEWKNLTFASSQEHDLILKPNWRYGRLQCVARAHKDLTISGHHLDFPDIKLKDAKLPLTDKKLVAGPWTFTTTHLGSFPQKFQVDIQEGQKTISHVAPASQILWTLSIAGDDNKAEPLSAPLIEDLDGDGRAEICISSNKNIFVLSPSYEIIAAFSIEKSQRILAAFDFDADGVKDIIALNGKGELVICDIVLKKTREISGAKVTGAFHSKDLNGDGNPELIFPIGGTQLAVMPSGKIKDLSTWADHKVASGTPIFKDLDGDGLNEVLVPDAEGMLYALDQEMKEKWRTKLPGTFGFVTINDFDPSDGLEILYVSKLDGEFLINCLTKDRDKLWVHKIPGFTVAWIASGQFVEGGKNEYILGGPQRISCFSKQKLLWSFEVKTGAITAFQCLDLNNDGVDEVLVGFSDGSAGCLSNGLEFKWKFKLDGAINGFADADFDADGDSEVVISSAKGQVMCVDSFDTTRLEARAYPLTGLITPRFLGPWLVGPAATAYHSKTWDRFQVTTTQTEGTKTALKMRSAMVWDKTRKEILVPNKHFIQQWNPGKRKLETRIKKPFVAGLTVSEDQLIAGSL
ncbi:MAG: protein kinase, partial [Planctomycetota bacterium]|nr:protein kinase [Planctomycetota bacterium]